MPGSRSIQQRQTIAAIEAFDGKTTQCVACFPDERVATWPTRPERRQPSGWARADHVLKRNAGDGYCFGSNQSPEKNRVRYENIGWRPL